MESRFNFFLEKKTELAKNIYNGILEKFKWNLGENTNLIKKGNLGKIKRNLEKIYNGIWEKFKNEFWEKYK